MVERAVAEFGRLDKAFNNAGVAGPSGPFLEETAEQFDQVNAVICVVSGPARNMSLSRCEHKAAEPLSTALLWVA